jgi:rhodanese-related sulfurtransferase
MRNVIKQILCMLVVAAGFALLFNGLSPRGIPWFTAWKDQVEKRAGDEGIQMVAFRTVQEAVNSPLYQIVDARSEADYAAGHIAGAVSLPFVAMEDHFELIGMLLDEAKPVILYCSSRSCDDALLLALELKAMGASALQLYVDGFEQWNALGGAVAGGMDD